MELNYTPIRTSKNYGINSINIDFDNQKIANLSKNNEKITKFSNFKFDIDKNVDVTFNANLKNSNTLNSEIEVESKTNNNFLCTAKINSSTSQVNSFNFNFDENNQNLISILNIIINSGVNSQIILNFSAKNSLEYYSNLNINFDVMENSNVDVIVFSELGKSATNLVSIQSNVAKNANFNINIVDIACKNSIFNYYSKIVGENGKSNLKSLYIGDGDSTIDLNYLIDIFAPHSSTDMDIIGSVLGNAKKHFKGTIDFKKGCPKSVGSENELCMLLSNTAKSKALPMILCTEEDVDGKHSSSVGKVNEKELFYIMSRGLTKQEATRLVIKARFNKIISSLFDEETKTKILNTIDRKIV